jgi:bidirectional [NiFe] hydrogenase diaphorase subunit
MTPEELLELAAKEQERQAGFKHNIRVCVAAGCMSTGSDKVKEALQNEVDARGLKEACQVKGVGCLGLCSSGPLLTVDNDYCRSVKPEDAAEIVDRLGEKPTPRLLVPAEMPFFARQLKIVLENSGVIDPERLEDYVAADGYQALLTALTEMTPNEVISQVTKSGLRGRGGGGYPTGLKWSTVAKADSSQKYIICNADEGDPGAFMDRSVLESDPHRVLEGMALAGYAVGADRGYIYVRAEYPLAIQRLRLAIRQAERAGLLGSEIAGTHFNFSVSVRLGAGAFVCGEETALMASIEGRRGQPRPPPPNPAQSGQ